MKRAELTWYRLGFPRDLDSAAVLAALSSLSGVPHGTRLVFDVAASPDGIVHRLAVSRSAARVAEASLHAAIPSLHMDEIETPAVRYRQRVLWQLSSNPAVIRTDNPDSIAAGLLMSLYPLGDGESLRLLWRLHPHPRPPLEVSQDERRRGQGQALRRKLISPGLGGYGELHVTAGSRARVRSLTQRVAAPLWSLGTPFGRLVADSAPVAHALRLFGQRGSWMSVEEIAAVVGFPIGGPDIPGLELGAAKRLVPAAGLPRSGRILGTSDYAGLRRTVSLSESASTKGLYLIGPTGTGKSTLIKNIVRDDLERGMGLALVETNGDLTADVLDLIPPHRVRDVVLIDPTDPTHATGFNPFAATGDASLVADQIGELFQRLWKDYFGPRTAQLAHMGMLTLARRRGSTLVDLPRLFLDEGFRARVLADLDDPVGLEPDWRWFQSLGEKEQAIVVAPLLNKVRQFTARSAIRAIVGQPYPAISMAEIVARRKVLLVNLPKGLIGSDTAKLLGCLILTSLWQAAAQRTGIAIADRHPFGLYVDEVQDFASAPIPWDEIFSQGRKYGMAAAVAHQALDQLPRELRAIILANTRSKIAFTLSSADATTLEKAFAPSLTAADLQALDAHSIAAIVALDDGSTARPVTLTTPPPPVPNGSAEAVRAASREQYATPRREVEARLRERARGPRRSASTPIGRRPRSAS